MVLLVNACARAESRTLPLALDAARRFGEPIEVVDLYRENVRPIDGETLARRRELSHCGEFSDPIFRYARQFAAADRVVIAAPYWDLSFPAILKCYVESVCVNGLTFRYSEEGIPTGLCRARSLTYVTTAGGYVPEDDFGYGYIRRVCRDFFGIPDAVCIKAEGLDILGADIEGILAGARREIAACLGER